MIWTAVYRLAPIGVGMLIIAASLWEIRRAEDLSSPPDPLSSSSMTLAGQIDLARVSDVGDRDPGGRRQSPAALRRQTLPVSARSTHSVSNSQPLKAGRPTVQMSREHRQTCVVFQGDKLPDFDLSNTARRSVSLGNVVGPASSVVIVWDSQQAMSRECIGRLRSELLDRHPSIRVVAIHVGKDGQWRRMNLAIDTAETHRVEHLLDEDKTSLEVLGDTLLPRIFLVDCKHEIVWLDVEYSRSTRRQLDRAIHELTKRAPSSGGI